MSKIAQELIDFHISNGYFIKAQRMKTANGCFIEYPKSSLATHNSEPFISSYFKVLREKNKAKEDYKEIEVPNYSARTLVVEDILLQMVKLKLNHKLIFCFDKDSQLLEDSGNVIDILDSPINSDDKTKEKSFLTLLQEVLLGLDCELQAKLLYLDDGYKIMKKIFQNGGICAL